MGDTLITVVAIVLSVVLVVVVPLVVTSQRIDDVSQLDVETLTSNFVDEMRATGKLTIDDYDKFLQDLTATGNTYDVSLEFKILDENPGKKSMQTTKDKIGENVYYSIYTTQIEEKLKPENGGVYNLKQGDIVTVTVRNTNLTLGQELKNFAYKIVGNDTYTISASNSGLIVGNGSTDVILAKDVNENTIGYTLRENNANGRILKDNDWTNQNVYVELYPTDSTYNLELIYYWRLAKEIDDYTTGYKNDGNIFTFNEANHIQVYWKHSVLEKYSNIRTININIDKIKPTIGSVTGTTTKGNTGTIAVSDVEDTGGSGLAAYYYAWTDKNNTTPPIALTVDTDGWTSSNSITVDSTDNGKKCWVWVKDKAGNISDPKSAVVENIVPKITGVKLNNAEVKKGENIRIDATIEGGSEYKAISFESSDSSIATIDSEGLATGVKTGETTITCTITNYDGTTESGTCILEVIENKDEVDPNPPTSIEIQAGYNTLEVKASGATDNLSGIAGYKYSIDGTNWTKTIAEGTSYIFTGIKSATTKTIYAKAVDNVSRESQTYSDEGTTKTIPVPIINIYADISKYTKFDVPCNIQATVIPDGYELQYSFNGSVTKTWETISSGAVIMVDTNMTVVCARIYNSTLDDEVAKSIQISNIDKVEPSAAQVISRKKALSTTFGNVKTSNFINSYATTEEYVVLPANATITIQFRLLNGGGNSKSRTVEYYTNSGKVIELNNNVADLTYTTSEAGCLYIYDKTTGSGNVTTTIASVTVNGEEYDILPQSTTNIVTPSGGKSCATYYPSNVTYKLSYLPVLAGTCIDYTKSYSGGGSINVICNGINYTSGSSISSNGLFRIGTVCATGSHQVCTINSINVQGPPYAISDKPYCYKVNIVPGRDSQTNSISTYVIDGVTYSPITFTGNTTVYIPAGSTLTMTTTDEVGNTTTYTETFN